MIAFTVSHVVTVYKRVVKVILHKAALPQQTDSSIIFARLCQCALLWGHIGSTWQIQLNLCFLWPIRVHNPNCKSIFAQLLAECRQAHWRHLANTIQLVLPLAHPSPQPIRQIDCFSHSCTTCGRVSSSTLMPSGEYDWTHAFFGPPNSTTQTVNWLVQQFLHRSWQKVPILYNRRPLPQNCSFPWGI